MSPSLPDKIVAVHHALAAASVPHAFGGALALAWCTRQARGTIDIDVNIFVSHADPTPALEALPADVSITDDDRELLQRDGQARLLWDRTPVDVFLNTTAFHEEVATRIRWEPFNGVEVPFLGCVDLAVFKAFFDRTKDWADLEAMHAAGCLDLAAVSGVLAVHLGPGDARIVRLHEIAAG